jgi:uncharacterized protein
MIVRVHDIEESLSVKGSFDGSKFKRPEDEEISFLAPISYDLEIVKSKDNLWVRGSVTSVLSLTCARCLTSFSYGIDADLDIELAPKNTAPDANEVELKSEELDIYYYDGEELDIDDYVYEEVILNLPIKALCSETCKGLCPSCGKNLNSEDCRCEKLGTSVLGEKLKSFLKEH